MTEKIRIAIVDDHPLFREGVQQTLSREPDIEVIGEGRNGNEAFRLAELKPDLMILDISMPGGGIETARTILSMDPGIRILFLTVSERESDVSAAMACGACGYLLKGVSARDLLEVVRNVHAGDSYVTPSLAAHLLRQLRTAEAKDHEKAPPGDELTAREEQILCFVAEGMTNKEIARKLSLSDKTIKHYMTGIMQKLQVRNRVEAAMRRPGMPARH